MLLQKEVELVALVLARVHLDDGSRLLDVEVGHVELHEVEHRIHFPANREARDTGGERSSTAF